jgi:hypothetical protein
MAFSLDVDHSQRRVRTVAAGPLTCPDLDAYLAALAAAGATDYTELVDARTATIPAEVTFVGVEQAARRLADSARGRGPARVAVVTEVPVTFGVACQLAVLAGPACQVRPFRDSVSAAEWLGWD